MEPPRRVLLHGAPEASGWRLLSPRELLAVASVLLVVSNSLIDHGSFIATRTTAPSIPAVPPVQEPPAAATASRLWELASSRSVSSDPRGVVLPLFDDIAPLGVSLLLELRQLQVDLPVEIPHCGDLAVKPLLQVLQRHNLTHRVSVYDVCEAAASATDATMARSSLREPIPRRPLFCEAIDDCHARFRSFDIKILAVLFSQFQEVLLVDADVLFFQSPMSLWRLDTYVATGTLFFPDRISATRKYLSRRVSGSGGRRSQLHAFIETFDREPFRHLETTASNSEHIRPGEPSEYLRATHAWNMRAGHHADSSVLLWNKQKLPRATAILGAFVALPQQHQRPPSYGDKELYFLACEVADTRYAFSHFGAGAIGWDVDTDRGVLCGDVLHFFPVNDPTRDRTSALYINSDHITRWKPSEKALYRSNARPASHFPGSFEARNLPQECPFDIQPMELTASEVDAIQRRQRFYETVIASWPPELDESEEEEDDADSTAPP